MTSSELSQMTKNVCVLAWLLFFSMISVVHAAEQTEHVEDIQLEANQEDEGERPNEEKAEQASKTKKEKIKELAIQVQNPVSDLVRFGFTNVMAFGAAPNSSNINIFNLNAKTMYVYYFHNYKEVVEFTLEDELKKGPHSYKIKSLFADTKLPLVALAYFTDRKKPMALSKSLPKFIEYKPEN